MNSLSFQTYFRVLKRAKPNRRILLFSHLLKDTIGTEESADSALLADAMAMSDGAPAEQQESAATRVAKHLSLRRETVLQWLHQTAGAGGSIACCSIVHNFVPRWYLSRFALA